MNLCLLYIGNDVDEKTKFTEDNDKNVFIYEAKNSDDILKKITEISQKVFNSNEINEIKEGKNTISFSTDVSLKEVTVFAQGKNVKIGKLNGEKSTDQVEVKYIDGEERQKPDKDLTGKIAIFKKSFKPGKYTIQVEGSKTTKIYFKPDIKLDVSVKKKNGDKVTDNYLAAGEYTLDCTLRDKGIDKPVKESKILRTVAFSAKGSNNEKKVKNNKNKEEINNGDSFKVEEGPLKIDATAKYLGNNEVSQSEKYTVVKDKKITFKFDEKKSPKYIVSSEGFKNGDKPIRMKAKIDGKPFDEKQWAKMDESEVKIEPAEKTKYKLGAFKVKKSKKDIGIFEVTPTLPGSLTGEPYKNTKVRISYDDTVGQKGSKTKWEGSSADTVKIKDDRNIFLKYRSLITKTAIGLLILILLLGWLLKKRLPKSLKSSPNIDGDPRTLRGKKSNHRGSFRKDFWSKVLPFVAEKGTIRFVPREVRGVPVMKVKAIGGNRMEIVNFRAYAEKPNVTFGGEPISPEDKKPKRIGPGTQVEVKEKDRKYTCILNS